MNSKVLVSDRAKTKAGPHWSGQGGAVGCRATEEVRAEAPEATALADRQATQSRAETAEQTQRKNRKSKHKRTHNNKTENHQTSRATKTRRPKT